MKAIAIIAAAGILAGCATSPERIEAAYVSPATYGDWACDQIHQEAHRISIRAGHLAGEQRQRRTRDTVATTVGVVLFWPALFFIRGDDAKTGELSRLRGEMGALRHASVGAGCPIEIYEAEPEPGYILPG